MGVRVPVCEGVTDVNAAFHSCDSFIALKEWIRLLSVLFYTIINGEFLKLMTLTFVKMVDIFISQSAHV